MKSLIAFALVSIMASVSLAAQECANGQGAIKYTSKTTLGRSALIQNPWLVLSDNTFAFFYPDHSDGSFSAGLNSGTYVRLGGDGRLLGSGQMSDNMITSVTCVK